jgi:hypothetical protein
MCDGETPVPVVPSPKFHAYVNVRPPESVDPAPLMLTAIPVTPEYGPPALAEIVPPVIVAVVVAVADPPA